MTARWLSDPGRPTELAWFFDAPWEAANQRRWHKYNVLATSSPIRMMSGVLALSAPAKDVLRQVIYGNPVAQSVAGQPLTEMMGLAPMFASRDPGDAANAVNVLDAGGTSNLCSAWLIGWGPRTVFMVSPDGDPPSLEGECGIAVADWRYVVRIANIDAVSPNFNALAMMAMASIRLPRLTCDENLRPMFYVTKDVENRLKDDVSKHVERFSGVPIRVIEELRSDEARIA